MRLSTDPTTDHRYFAVQKKVGNPNMTIFCALEPINASSPNVTLEVAR
jgi:hypothetical protein